MSQLEVLRKLLSDGKTHSVIKLEERIARVNGRKPSRGAMHVYLNKLKGEGFKFEVERGEVTKYTAVKVPRAARQAA